MESMRGLLRESLGRSLEALEELDRLAAAWPVACGTAMAAHGEVVSYRDGLVRILVSDREWLQQMQSMAEVLRRELARIAAAPVTAIHFEVKRF